jgi:hypothetical protein
VTAGLVRKVVVVVVAKAEGEHMMPQDQNEKDAQRANASQAKDLISKGYGAIQAILDRGVPRRSRPASSSAAALHPRRKRHRGENRFMVLKPSYAVSSHSDSRWPCTEQLLSLLARCVRCSGGYCCGAVAVGTSSGTRRGSTWADTGGGPSHDSVKVKVFGYVMCVAVELCAQAAHWALWPSLPT